MTPNLYLLLIYVHAFVWPLIEGVTVSSLLAKAVSETLKKHPVMNAVYVEGGIKYSTDINVAMAVAIDGGLITPTITKSQGQDLFAISSKWKELVGKAKAGKFTYVHACIHVCINTHI